MKPVALVLASLLMLGTAAHAADDASCAPAASTDPVPPPKIGDDHIAAALDVLEANGTANNLTAMLDAMAPVQALEIQHARPDLSKEQIAVLQTAIRNAMVTHLAELKRIVAIGYAQHFSEEELKTLAAFYRSDVGHKYVTTIPILLKELTPVEIAWVLGIVQDAVKGALTSAHNSGEHT